MNTNSLDLSRRRFLQISAFALASPALINFHGVARAMGKTQEVSSKPIIRGVYSEAEKKMLEETNKWINENKTGWIQSGIATEEEMKYYSYVCDQWNPLWRDEKYAEKTRWGGIIPFPCFNEKFGSGTISWKTTQECGYASYTKFGEEFEWFKPIRVGDKIRTWSKGANIVIKDTTPLDGKGPRQFEALTCDVERVNQNDELVCTEKKWNGRQFRFEMPKPTYIPDYGYTEEELKYLYDITRQEEIRGARIRYWEDVNINDELKPVVFGPTSILDVVRGSTQITFAPDIIPSRVPPGPVEEKTRPGIGQDGYHIQAIGPWQFIPDPETGLLYTAGFPHYDDRTAQATGVSRPYLFAVQGRTTMARVITNWMGDDAFLKRFKWMHMTRSTVGDAWVGRGKVVDKRVDKGEYLVDLKVWLENIRGFTSESAFATVRLVSSKGVPYSWN